MRVARYGAVLDLDGVVVRTGPLHDRVWSELAAERRRVTVAETLDNLKQITRRAISADALARELFPELATDEAAVKMIVAEKDRRYEAMLRHELEINPKGLCVPGVCEFTGELAEARVPLALNTSSPVDEARAILSAIGILPHFSVLLAREHVQKPKPDPEGYQLAAKYLGFHPQFCIGCEDSIPGLRALKAAGYGVIVAVGSILSEEQVRAERPWIARYIPDFTGFTRNDLSGLIRFGQV